MYKSYKLVKFIVNTNGGESEEISHLTKEVKTESGIVVVPKTETESINFMLSETARIGGNASTQAVKTMLFNPDGNMIKVEEIKKSDVVIDTKKLAIDKAVADYVANQTDENLEKFINAVATKTE